MTRSSAMPTRAALFLFARWGYVLRAETVTWNVHSVYAHVRLRNVRTYKFALCELRCYCVPFYCRVAFALLPTNVEHLTASSSHSSVSQSIYGMRNPIYHIANVFPKETVTRQNCFCAMQSSRPIQLSSQLRRSQYLIRKLRYREVDRIRTMSREVFSIGRDFSSTYVA